MMQDETNQACVISGIDAEDVELLERLGYAFKNHYPNEAVTRVARQSAPDIWHTPGYEIAFARGIGEENAAAIIAIELLGGEAAARDMRTKLTNEYRVQIGKELERFRPPGFKSFADLVATQ